VNWVEGEGFEGLQGKQGCDEQFIDDYFLKKWNRERLIPLWNYNGKEVWQTDM
jgi:hypothetical protein